MREGGGGTGHGHGWWCVSPGGACAAQPAVRPRFSPTLPPKKKKRAIGQALRRPARDGAGGDDANPGREHAGTGRVQVQLAGAPLVMDASWSRILPSPSSMVSSVSRFISNVMLRVGAMTSTSVGDACTCRAPPHKMQRARTHAWSGQAERASAREQNASERAAGVREGRR